MSLRAPTVAELHEIGAALFGMSFAIIAGIVSAQGKPVPDWTTIGIGVATGWFFGVAVNRQGKEESQANYQQKGQINNQLDVIHTLVNDRLDTALNKIAELQQELEKQRQLPP